MRRDAVGHAWLLWLVIILAPGSGWTGMTQPERPPGATVEYRIEPLHEATDPLAARFTAEQLSVLEKLNRADVVRLSRQRQLVVPAVWYDDETLYSPFPLRYPAVIRHPKFLVVDQPAQAFAAYEAGRLVRWGPVSSGRQAHPTPDGLFHLNWRSQGRHSTVNPRWFMRWYVNFHNTRGLALHEYDLPGYPASHACIRLLERDAAWMYHWGEVWTLDARGITVLEPGTPLLIVGQYAFAEPAPWRSLEHLARGIVLPASPDAGSCAVQSSASCPMSSQRDRSDPPVRTTAFERSRRAPRRPSSRTG
jgi:hypothetical protein